MNDLMESIKKSPVTRTVFNADGSSVSSILLIEPTDGEVEEAKKNYNVVFYYYYQSNKLKIDKLKDIRIIYTYIYINSYTKTLVDFSCITNIIFDEAKRIFLDCEYRLDVEINLSRLKKRSPDVILNDIFEED